MRFYKRFLEFWKISQRVYLDYASSSPLDAKMLSRVPKITHRSLAANPSALHAEGVALRRVLENARKRAAAVLDVHGDEIIFTSGATESDNIAIVGQLYQWITEGIAPNEIVIFLSELEHAAVTETIGQFVRMGVQQNMFPLNDGVIDAKGIIAPEHARAVFITAMYVNNEIGTVQPIAEIAKRVRKLRKLRPELKIVFSTHATQAPVLLLRIPTLGVDLMTLGATKLYCPKGVGMLYKKRSTKLMPMLHGGGQEFGLRPGTEPVELIHSFAYALEYANSLREKETERIKNLDKYFEDELIKRFPHIKITAQDQSRSPHITHVAVPNFDSELLVIELDARGIAVSAKSACKNDNDDEPRVVEQLYGKNHGAIRFSFGRMTTKKHLNIALKALHSVFRKYKK